MTNRRKWFLFIAFVSVTANLSAQESATTSPWPQFRGGRFNHVLDVGTLPAEIQIEKGLKWEVSVPSGASTPVIWKDRIVLTSFDGTGLFVECRSLADGQLIWSAPIKVDQVEPYFASLGSPAASTSCVDENGIISYFGSFGLICHDWDGKEKWSAPMPLPQTRDQFGTGTSPVLHDNKVYLQRDEDGPGAGLYAFDAKTGKQIWKTTRDGFRVSFGTPVVWDNSLVVIGDVRVKGYDLETGAEKWTIIGTAAYPCTSPSVADDGNLVIATWSPGSSNEPGLPDHAALTLQLDTGKDGKLSRKDIEASFLKDFFDVNDKNKNDYLDQDEWDSNLRFMERGTNVVLVVRPGGNGDISDSHVVWQSEKGAPYVASPLAYKNRVHLVKDGGLLTTYDLTTGDILSGPKRIGSEGDYYASPLGMDGKILTISLEGGATILSATDSPEVLWKGSFGERVWASPIVTDNTLLIRTKTKLKAIDLAAK
jgi:outer membrane protein assembly factor BamB